MAINATLVSDPYAFLTTSPAASTTALTAMIPPTAPSAQQPTETTTLGDASSDGAEDGSPTQVLPGLLSYIAEPTSASSTGASSGCGATQQGPPHAGLDLSLPAPAMSLTPGDPLQPGGTWTTVDPPLPQGSANSGTPTTQDPSDDGSDYPDLPFPDDGTALGDPPDGPGADMTPSGAITGKDGGQPGYSQQIGTGTAEVHLAPPTDGSNPTFKGTSIGGSYTQSVGTAQLGASISAPLQQPGKGIDIELNATIPFNPQ